MNIRAVGKLQIVSGVQSGDGATGRPGSRAAVDILVYTFARLVLVVVLTAVILGLGHLLGIGQFPVVVAVLFALVLALPLGIWMFAPLRRRATASLAVVDERRRHDKAQLRARLRGDESAPQ